MNFLGGYDDFVNIWGEVGVIAKLGYFLRVTFMHFRVFSYGQCTEYRIFVWSC